MKPLCNSVYKLCVTLCLIFCGLQAYSQQSAGLIVGISHYKELDSLQFAHRDAAAFAEFLKTQNVPDDNIKLFLNEDATRFNIVDELYNLTQKLNKGDKFYFYFTGHGDLEAKIGYENSLLLLHGCYKKNYFQGTEYLQLSELRTWFGQLTKKGIEVIFIADACHSGGLIGGKEGLDKTQKALQESWQGITKILSSQANEFSLEGKQWGGGRGIFSYFLVNGLTGRADANKDKKVNLKELDNYLKTNVVREANPNTQTPVIQGNAKQTLSQSSEAGLKKLADAERLSFPIITEANLKAADPMTMIGGLDKTLVETYNKFTKALAEKRLNTFDNEKDYALLHYRKLVAEKVPEHLLAIMKRNLGAALMEREIIAIKGVREKGEFRQLDKSITAPAINNLEEAIKLLGIEHYLYKHLKSRIMRLEAFERKMFVKAEDYKKDKANLLTSSLAEPNDIASYVVLAGLYRNDPKPDSNLFYLEKIAQLLPNQGLSYYNLAIHYSQRKYSDENGQTAIHPKFNEYMMKAIEVEPTLWIVYNTLGNTYMDLVRGASPNRDNKKAISYFEKALPLVEQEYKVFEKKRNSLLDQGFNEYSKEIIDLSNVNGVNFRSLSHLYTTMYSVYRALGNDSMMTQCQQKVLQKTIPNLIYPFITVKEIANWYFEKNDDFYLKNAVEVLESCLDTLDKRATTIPIVYKNIYAFNCRELLKSLGAIQRIKKNYSEAENAFKKAINIPYSAYDKNIEWYGGYFSFNNRDIMAMYGGIETRQGLFSYIDANVEMAYLKLEQNEPNEALSWIEKAMQEKDTKKEKFFKTVFSKADILDKIAYQALLDKYFPPTEKK